MVRVGAQQEEGGDRAEAVTAADADQDEPVGQESAAPGQQGDHREGGQPRRDRDRDEHRPPTGDPGGDDARGAQPGARRDAEHPRFRQRVAHRALYDASGQAERRAYQDGGGHTRDPVVERLADQPGCGAPGPEGDVARPQPEAPRQDGHEDSPREEDQRPEHDEEERAGRPRGDPGVRGLPQLTRVPEAEREDHDHDGAEQRGRHAGGDGGRPVGALHRAQGRVRDEDEQRAEQPGGGHQEEVPAQRPDLSGDQPGEDGGAEADEGDRAG